MLQFQAFMDFITFREKNPVEETKFSYQIKLFQYLSNFTTLSIIKLSNHDFLQSCWLQRNCKIIQHSTQFQLKIQSVKVLMLHPNEKHIPLSATSLDRLYVKRSPVASNKKDTHLSWVQFPWTSKGRKYRKDRTS